MKITVESILGLMKGTFDCQFKKIFEEAIEDKEEKENEIEDLRKEIFELQKQKEQI